MTFTPDLDVLSERKKTIIVEQKQPLRFIDLFAGLGGFHVALESLGAECLFAAEKESHLNKLYTKNFKKLSPEHVVSDITKHDLRNIPEHDILCAGFPCQPFSKAGKRKGMKDPTNGGLFDIILEIIDLQIRKPSYLLLENVPNILSLEKGKYWAYILEELKERGYSVDYELLSPHEFGIPQHRKRVFIVASQNGLDHFEWPKKGTHNHNIDDFVINEVKNIRELTEDKVEVLSLWQEFLTRLKGQNSLGFPVWSTEFGATYPVEVNQSIRYDIDYLKNYKGSFGLPIVKDNSIDRNNVPVYMRDARRTVKSWKKNYILKNRELYQNNKSWIDGWKKEIMKFPHSLQKLEWNCQDEERIIEDKIVQFRPSGVRIKSKNSIPTLVAMNMTQVPYFPWLNRYMSIREGLALQGLNSLEFTLESLSQNYRALGNAVNSEVVRLISKQLLKEEIK